MKKFILFSILSVLFYSAPGYAMLGGGEEGKELAAAALTATELAELKELAVVLAVPEAALVAELAAELAALIKERKAKRAERAAEREAAPPAPKPAATLAAEEAGATGAAAAPVMTMQDQLQATLAQIAAKGSGQSVADKIAQTKAARAEEDRKEEDRKEEEIARASTEAGRKAAKLRQKIVGYRYAFSDSESDDEDWGDSQTRVARAAAPPAQPKPVAKVAAMWENMARPAETVSGVLQKAQAKALKRAEALKEKEAARIAAEDARKAEQKAAKELAEAEAAAAAAKPQKAPQPPADDK